MKIALTILLLITYIIYWFKKPLKRCKDCPYSGTDNNFNFDICMYCEFGR